LQFVVHGETLIVVDDLGKDFFSGLNLFLVKLVKPSPLGFVVHQFFDASSRTVQSGVKGHDLVDLNFNFHFHRRVVWAENRPLSTVYSSGSQRKTES